MRLRARANQINKFLFPSTLNHENQANLWSCRTQILLLLLSSSSLLLLLSSSSSLLLYTFQIQVRVTAVKCFRSIFVWAWQRALRLKICAWSDALWYEIAWNRRVQFILIPRELGRERANEQVSAASERVSAQWFEMIWNRRYWFVDIYLFSMGSGTSELVSERANRSARAN